MECVWRPTEVLRREGLGGLSCWILLDSDTCIVINRRPPARGGWKTSRSDSRTIFTITYNLYWQAEGQRISAVTRE